VFRKNNLGFNGPDIKLSENNKYIILLGNSFIEANQYSGSQIAAAYIQREMGKVDSLYQVINLGASAHDPYVLWYRLLFFEEFYRPEKVVLVYESFETLKRYYARWISEPPQYQDEVTINEHIPSKLVMTQRKIRRLSAFLNLTVSLISKESKETNDASEQGAEPLLFTDEVAIEYLFVSLLKYSIKYKEKFVFVSLMRDNPFDQELIDLCKEWRIKFYSNKEIMLPVNKIGGVGHLNRIGNRRLGLYLAEVLKEDWNKPHLAPSIE